MKIQHIVLLFVLIAAGCFTSCIRDEEGCVPGATQSCFCSDGEQGAQVCDEVATWDRCHCRGSDGDGDADTDADTDSDSDVNYGTGNCPGHRDMVLISSLSVCIDQYEASSGPDGEARSIAGALGWNDVTWYEARVACQLAGKRLCEPLEWADACQGPQASLYPYGDVYEPERCWGADISGYPYGSSPTTAGSMTGCEGGLLHLFDMSGNLWEWTADCTDDDCQMRGGSYQDDREDLICSSVYEGDGDRSYRDTGFRCCLSL